MTGKALSGELSCPGDSLVLNFADVTFGLCFCSDLGFDVYFRPSYLKRRERKKS